MTQKLSIIVPCYNEAQVIELFFKALLDVTRKVAMPCEYIFINDGSTDQTLDLIKGLSKTNADVKFVSFSRNFGKEAAIYAGLQHAQGDLVVVMDADLQHPPELILEMLTGIEEGYDTVTTKRVSREGEPKLKSLFSKLFYRLMHRITEINIVDGAQDFRMMKRDVVDAILELNEYNRFSKGIFSWVGFNVKYIEVENVPRAAGETKWSFKKLFNYAIDGITAFSVAPLRFASVIGILISFFSFLYLIQIVLKTIFIGADAPGYPSLMAVMLFMGGLQLIFIGVLSEYISKIYLEVKARPQYVIRESTYKLEKALDREKIS